MQVFNIITGLNNGGAEAVLYRLCTNDQKATHTVISMMDKGKYGALLEAAGVKVYCLNMPQGKLTVNGIFMLYQILKKSNPDVVQTWMYHADFIGGLISKLAGVKNIFWGVRHSNLELDKTNKVTIFIAKLCAYLSKVLPRGIVCCADKALSTHAAIGYDKDKLKVIYNGYRLDQFDIDVVSGVSLKKELNIEDKSYVLGLVGRFNPQKDHANLLASLAHLKKRVKNFSCILVGAGINNDNEQLLKQIEVYGLREQVLLLDQRSDIPVIMNSLDVHILSSTTEGFPNVLAEAMACGTPCVTTDVGDAALIVGDTGWVVPRSNPKALCEALIEAYEEKQAHNFTWQQRKYAARQRIVENFSIETMIDKYHAVWRG